MEETKEYISEHNKSKKRKVISKSTLSKKDEKILALEKKFKNVKNLEKKLLFLRTQDILIITNQAEFKTSICNDFMNDKEDIVNEEEWIIKWRNEFKKSKEKRAKKITNQKSTGTIYDSFLKVFILEMMKNYAEAKEVFMDKINEIEDVVITSDDLDAPNIYVKWYSKYIGEKPPKSSIEDYMHFIKTSQYLKCFNQYIQDIYKIAIRKKESLQFSKEYFYDVVLYAYNQCKDILNDRKKSEIFHKSFHKKYEELKNENFKNITPKDVFRQSLFVKSVNSKSSYNQFKKWAHDKEDRFIYSVEGCQFYTKMNETQCLEQIHSKKEKERKSSYEVAIFPIANTLSDLQSPPSIISYLYFFTTKHNGLDRVFWGFKANNEKVRCQLDKRKVQKDAMSYISKSIDEDNKKAILLHMGTGTGKTFVGIETAFKLAGRLCKSTNTVSFAILFYTKSKILRKFKIEVQKIRECKNNHGIMLDPFDEGQREDVEKKLAEQWSDMIYVLSYHDQKINIPNIFKKFTHVIVVLDECHVFGKVYSDYYGDYFSLQNKKKNKKVMGKYSSIINNIKKAHALVMMTATPFSSLIPINDISFALNFDIILKSQAFHVIKYDNESIGNEGDKMITFQKNRKIECFFKENKGEDKLYALCYFLSKYLLLRGKKKKNQASVIDCTTVIPDQHGIESHVGVYETLLMTDKCTTEIHQSMIKNANRKYVVYIENKICIYFFIFLWFKKYGIKSSNHVGVITGESNQIQQDVLQKSFVDSQSLLKILIISKAGEAGIDLYYKDVELHMLQIPWTYVSEKQVQGRVNRCTTKEEQELLHKEFVVNNKTMEIYKEFYRKLPYREIIYYYLRFEKNTYTVSNNLQTKIHNKMFQITKLHDLKKKQNGVLGKNVHVSETEITKGNITDIILWSLLDPMEQYDRPQNTLESFAKEYMNKVFECLSRNKEILNTKVKYNTCKDHITYQHPVTSCNNLTLLNLPQPSQCNKNKLDEVYFLVIGDKTTMTHTLSKSRNNLILIEKKLDVAEKAYTNMNKNNIHSFQYNFISKTKYDELYKNRFPEEDDDDEEGLDDEEIIIYGDKYIVDIDNNNNNNNNNNKGR
jgi:hypothetical protein